jgi:hypothetical protein
MKLLNFRTYANTGGRQFYENIALQIALQAMEKLNFKSMVVSEQVALKIIEHGLKQVSEKVAVRE